MLDLAHRTCANDASPSACLGDSELAFFIAQNGSWTLVAVGPTYTCATISRQFGYRGLSPQLCADALSS